MNALFPITTLLSAFLLFQIQPLIARVILPSFGGTPAVWTTCMLFFQALLVGGYGYGHVVATRLGPGRQAAVHTGFVALALSVLGLAAARWGSPLVPPPGYAADASGAPILEIIRLLFITVGVPYLVLSTTGPLVQSWARLADPARSPYRLYALSNIGSLAGLLLYPTVIEPVLGLRAQAWFFAGLFLCFGVSVIGCGRLVAPITPVAVAVDGEAGAGVDAPPRAAHFLAWMGLAAVASALLLSTTNQLCQDVAAIPLLWVVPLSLYLISFILSFDRPAWYPRWLWMPLYAAGAALAVYMLPRSTMRVGVQIPAWSLLLFSGCMVCHGELARSRPQPRYLTGFWFAVSVGGAIGGLFVSVLAPKLMSSYFEVHIAIAAGAVALCLALWFDRTSPLHSGHGSRLLTVLALGAIFANSAWLLAHKWMAAHETLLYAGAAVLALVLGLLLWMRPQGQSLSGDDPFWARMGLPVALAALCIGLANHARGASKGALFMSRSFFGVLRVTEDDADDPKLYRRLLTHGRIVHGFQLLTPEGPHTPSTYYEPKSGIGRAIRLHPRRQAGLRLGMCGLGTGTVASYLSAKDSLRFYEIDPNVVALSRAEKPWFRYLADARGKVDVVMGDARISLQRELDEGHPNAFDVLAIDAFSGDAIPVHLLTKEAVALYMQHLAPDGVLALHISNRHLKLLPVVKAIAGSLGLSWILVDTSYPDEDVVAWDSTWVLVARNPPTLTPYGPGDEPGVVVDVRPFTDEFSNIMKLLKL